MSGAAGIDRRTAMKITGAGVTGAGLSAATPVAAASAASIAATYPRVEWRIEPVGIDTTRPRFRWEVAGRDPAARGVVQSACRVILGEDRRAVAAGRGDLWDSGMVAGVRPTAQPDQPLPLRSHQDYWWAVELRDEAGRSTGVSAPQRFVTGLMTAADWSAPWIAAGPDRPRGSHGRCNDRSPARAPEPLPVFRRELNLPARPRRAILSIAALGHGDVTVNGTPVDTAVMNPGWTDYRHTVLYTSHDVTALLRRGGNAIGVMLGNGMYNVERVPGRYVKFVDSFGRPKLIAQLDVTLEDGRTLRIVSDGEWQVREGPIRYSSAFGGEDVDAREDQLGWDRPGHRGAGWRAATLVEGPGGVLRAQGIPGMTRAGVLPVVRTDRLANGRIVHDFGINGSGRPHVVLRGPAGSRVRLYPGEALGPDGAVSQRSFNASPANAVWFEYTLAGTGAETFRPRFLHQGFRYLEAELTPPPGDGDAPRIEALTVETIHAALPLAGQFECSEPLFAATHRLIDQALRSNMASVLTDCPHREKLGWLEQTHLNAATVFYNRDAAALYEKITRDIADAQQADGMVPGIAPEYIAFLDKDGRDTIWRNSPEWGVAAVLSPWAAYRSYGDAEVLRAGYPAMARYMAYLRGRAVAGIIDFGMGDWYDLGPKPPGESQLTTRALTGTAIWYEALTAMAAIAPLVGRPADAARWRAEGEMVRGAFERRFWNAAQATYDTGSQCALAMPLALGLVPAAREWIVLDALVAAVRANGNGVTAGDVGFRYVVAALTAHGRDDVLDAMMRVTDRPGYGQQLANGATSLAEAWDANPTKSLNHFMLGHAEGWFYGALAGIRVDFTAGAPERILTVAPRLAGATRAVAARHRTVLGEVASRWQRQGATSLFEVTIPPGPGATIILPVAEGVSVREGGRPLAEAPGVVSATRDAAGLAIVVGSGRYRFAPG
ncbi:MAG: family 78 glycoside hydrolase catalytic domain [Sphingomonas taxi]